MNLPMLKGIKGKPISCPECGYTDPHNDIGCFTLHNSAYTCPECEKSYDVSKWYLTEGAAPEREYGSRERLDCVNELVEYKKKGF